MRKKEKRFDMVISDVTIPYLDISKNELFIIILDIFRIHD